MAVNDSEDRSMVAPRALRRAGKKRRKQQRHALFAGHSAFYAGALTAHAACFEALRCSPFRVYNAAIFDAVLWRGRMNTRDSGPMNSSHTNR
ncbi:hypothetical protein [Paraburkholderia sp. J94]|uniref:hypothetical protein n=1 Tax=Paraburkholderia sp. J94 TaxID=2805441 RepID=UPI002AB1B3DE|nr:hypothetical protein [Paraburkholderia sp. J94]